MVVYITIEFLRRTPLLTLNFELYKHLHTEKIQEYIVGYHTNKTYDI